MNHPELSKELRFSLITLAWVVIIAATFPGSISFPWLLPIGVFWAVVKEKALELNFTSGKIALCWIPYFGLTVAAILTKRRIAFFATYTVLCLLLVLGAVGCQEMFHQHFE